MSDYSEYFGNATIAEIGDALKQSRIGWVMPSDPTVGAYNSYFSGATSVVEKSDGSVRKRQVSYLEFSLLENEARILEKCDSKHIPRLLKRGEEEIEIEDCGEHLTVDNLPEDWKEQFVQIIQDLRAAGVRHNDFKLGNLMVKDGIVKLIDFGFSSLEEEDISHFPDCLGMPNRYYLGPNDNYSAKCVIKQMQYKIDRGKNE